MLGEFSRDMKKREFMTGKDKSMNGSSTLELGEKGRENTTIFIDNLKGIGSYYLKKDYHNIPTRTRRLHVTSERSSFKSSMTSLSMANYYSISMYTKNFLLLVQILSKLRSTLTMKSRYFKDLIHIYRITCGEGDFNTSIFNFLTFYSIKTQTRKYHTLSWRFIWFWRWLLGGSRQWFLRMGHFAKLYKRR